MARDRERESVLRTRTGNRASCTRFAETGSQSGGSDCGAGRHTQQNEPCAALPRRPAHIQCKVEASGWCFDESPHLTKVSGELGIIADEFVAGKRVARSSQSSSSSEPMRMEQTPTRLPAIRTMPSSVLPMVNASFSTALSRARAAPAGRVDEVV